jgi:hypothetical protein
MKAQISQISKVLILQQFFLLLFWCEITTFRLQKWEYFTTQEKKERMNE